ncbi:hypothetical protein CPHLJ_6g3060 [Cryptosporidium parvum]|uniref:Uncharacterized protein n=1 Tax=Cryptosporidium parvum TaxID=5807 RepID=A0A7S7LEU1_CRYPV|nr:Uncharacterized protein CPATCC_0014620 [Cryptosporidium parvum]WKS78418.1 hypothetical protein CPCDC_6g3060 [Cryptosporidium sp. 43IA8]WRK32910.1 Uncharacterized protein cpbgf_6003060 [Cryptosporidium parvum]|eukprot:QOY41190.1 hypothetical protein CPATCC_002848 [Cryptosporidium parvum]
MASSLLENDIISQNIGNGLISKKKSKKKLNKFSKSSNSELEKQQNDKKEYYPTKNAMMESEDDDLTDEEFEEYEEYEEDMSNFDYLKIFKIPLILFILSFISVLFVDLFGKDYLGNELENGIYNMIDPNYGSFIWNLSEKQIDKVRIEDIQVAIQMLLMYVDNHFNQTKLTLDGLESKLSKSITENKDTLIELNNQIDKIEREISHKTDYLEKMISESKL